jgi:hypothetical protein
MGSAAGTGVLLKLPECRPNMLSKRTRIAAAVVGMYAFVCHPFYGRGSSHALPSDFMFSTWSNFSQTLTVMCCCVDCAAAGGHC